jgi:nucleoside-diphosphate-sugar epimerase
MGLDSIISPRDRTLVTGSNGFIGAKVVQILLEYGFTNIRCFVRSSSRLEQLERIINEFADTGRNIDVIKGDLLSREDCREAAREVSLIYHLAAGFDKSFAGAFMNSVITTRNLMDAFLKVGRPKRFVNVSSFAVYSNLKLKRGTLVDESCPLENAPQQRFDAYGFGKLKQEQLVREYGIKHKLPYVILRPGYVFGPGKRELNGRVGIDTFGFFVQVGGSNCLPLTFVDNCADAIVLAGLKPGIDGETFNVVDDELMSSRQFLNAYKKVNRFRSIRLPYSFAYGMCSLWEKYSEWSKGQLPPVFNRRRCAAEWKPMRYSNSKLKQRLGWRPRVPMNKAIEAFVGQLDSKEKVKADTLKC